MGAISLLENRVEEMRGLGEEPEMETKPLCLIWDKLSEQTVCPTKTNSLPTFMYYLSA